MSWRSGWFLDCAPKTLTCVSSPAVLAARAYYFEVTITEGGADGTSGYGILFGIAGSTTNLTGTVCSAVLIAQGNCAGACFVNTRANNPFESVNGWGYPVRPAFGGITEIVGTTGVYGVKLDTINKTIAIRNITDSSPAAGAYSSESFTGMITGSVYILAGASHGTGAAKGAGTINFGATAFTATTPASHVSIESVFPGAALNPSDNSNIVLSGGNLSFAGTSVPVAFSPRPPDVAFDTNVGYHNAVRSRFAIAQS